MNKLCLIGAAALIATAFPSRRGFCPARWWRNARRWDGRLPRRRDGRRFPRRWDGWRFPRGRNRRWLSGSGHRWWWFPWRRNRPRLSWWHRWWRLPKLPRSVRVSAEARLVRGGFRGAGIAGPGFRGPVRVAGFRGGGFRRGWGGWGWGLPLAGVGLGLGYYGYSSYYSDPCVVWDGYTWVDACY